MRSNLQLDDNKAYRFDNYLDLTTCELGRKSEYLTERDREREREGAENSDINLCFRNGLNMDLNVVLKSYDCK